MASYKIGDVVVVLGEAPVREKIDTVGQVTQSHEADGWYQVTFRIPPDIDITWFGENELRPATDVEILKWRLTK